METHSAFNAMCPSKYKSPLALYAILRVIHFLPSSSDRHAVMTLGRTFGPESRLVDHRSIRLGCHGVKRIPGPDRCHVPRLVSASGVSLFGEKRPNEPSIEVRKSGSGGLSGGSVVSPGDSSRNGPFIVTSSPRFVPLRGPIRNALMYKS